MKLDKNNHSVFLLYYHLILCVKYRKKVITEDISVFLKNIFYKIENNYKVKLEEFNHDKDHIHILFRAEPTTDISQLIGVYKSISSRLVKKQYPQVKMQLYKEMFWSPSFCLMSTGGARVDTIKKYIESQGENHDNQSKD